MNKDVYNTLIEKLPEKFRKDVKDEIEFNHMDLEPITNDIFLTACKWVLDNKKLHLRRVAVHVSCELIEERKKEIQELESYIDNFEEIAV